MRVFKLVALLLAVALVLPPMARAAAPAALPSPPDPPWPGRQTSFVVVMQQAAGTPDSAITAQMNLEPVLAALRRIGHVSRFAAYYGPNAILVTGNAQARRFLAAWPSVARIDPYRPGQAWEQALDAASATAPDATGRITGTVTGPDGITPLAGITVTTWRRGTTRWEIAGSATTAGDGTYEISGLATGTYRVGFTDPDPAKTYATEYYDDQRDFETATQLSVFDGSTVSGINASLALAGRIAGVVTSPSGTAGDVIVAAWQYRNNSWVQDGTAVTASNGTYQIRGLAPGAYLVSFSDLYLRFVTEWYFNVPNRGLATPINVTGGETTSGINALVGTYGYIDGIVTAFDGAAVADVAVTAYQYNPILATYQTISQTVTAADGLYLFELLGGTYRIGFSDTLGQLLPEYYNDKATLEAATNVPVSADGEPTSGIDAVLDAATTTGDVSLATGWNLISSYLHPAAAAPSAVFAGIAGQYDLVYAYNGCQPAAPWSKYDPAAPPYANNLTAVNVTQGLWLRATAPVTLTITGRPPIGTQIALCTGWNLIGYPAAAARPVAEALAGIAGKYNLVQTYDASDVADPWKEYNPADPGAADLTELRPWRGYWIRMTQAATLTVGNR